MKFPNLVQRLIILVGVLAIILIVFYPVEEIISHGIVKGWRVTWYPNLWVTIDAPMTFVRIVAVTLVVIGLVLVASNKKY